MRIIGGMAGGLKLASPRGRQVRPTLDRVRESIFAALGDLRGARVADLYAGTGALGIEALSRGAEFAFFVERAAPSIRCLRGNVTRLLDLFERQRIPIPEVRFWTGDTRDAPARTPELARTLSVILADPPYGMDAPRNTEAVALLENEEFARWSGDALLVLEHAAHVAAMIAAHPRWRVLRQKRYGLTAVTFLRRAQTLR